MPQRWKRTCRSSFSAIPGRAVSSRPRALQLPETTRLAVSRSPTGAIRQSSTSPPRSRMALNNSSASCGRGLARTEMERRLSEEAGIEGKNRGSEWGVVVPADFYPERGLAGGFRTARLAIIPVYPLSRVHRMIRGSVVAIVTPMAEDGSVDFPALERLVEWHVAVGTTGESATLDVEEHVAVVRAVVETARKRVPVIAGTGANSTAEAIELTAEGKAAGADACLLVTPYYNKPPQEGLYRHYKAIAEAVDVPIVLYNVPGRTGCDLLPATVKRLAAIPNIIGLKEAKGELGRVKELLALLPPEFILLSGDDATACESILL